MAGHSKFHNIKHRKGAQDKKRAKIFTKALREVYTAAKLGGVDPDMNARLRLAVTEARSLNVPKDRIEAAIVRASNPQEGDDYEEIRYEGYANGGVALIVEALTDNRNRTASEVRSAFTKNGGNLGETGSVSFMFDHIGYIEYALEVASEEAMLEAALEAGAENCETYDDSHIIITTVETVNDVREALLSKFGDPVTSKLIWQAQNPIYIDDKEKAEKLMKLIDVLEDSDDVQNVYGAYEMDTELIK